MNSDTCQACGGTGKTPKATRVEVDAALAAKLQRHYTPNPFNPLPTSVDMYPDGTVILFGLRVDPDCSCVLYGDTSKTDTTGCRKHGAAE